MITKDQLFMCNIKMMQLISQIIVLNEEIISKAEELAPLFLFNNNLEDKQRQKIASKILSLKNYVTLNEITSKRKRLGFGKSIFPMVPKMAVNGLTDFIGEDSPAFFTILNINSSFLREPVTEWRKNEDFLASKNVVSSLSVVNDSAERRVKLYSDFAGTAKKENKFQNIIQVVENNRNMLPN